MKLTHSICGTTGKTMKGGKWGVLLTSLVRGAKKLGAIGVVTTLLCILMVALIALAAATIGIHDQLTGGTGYVRVPFLNK